MPECRVKKGDRIFTLLYSENSLVRQSSPLSAGRIHKKTEFSKANRGSFSSAKIADCHINQEHSEWTKPENGNEADAIIARIIGSVARTIWADPHIDGQKCYRGHNTNNPKNC